MKALVTGGAGYIGSTVASALLDAGIDVVVLDDLSTGLEAFASGRALYVGDIADGALLDRIVADHPDIDVAVHCAAKIIVPESVAQPLEYYDTNVGRGVRMLGHLRRHGIRRIVFSSSASIYAASADLTVTEQSPVDPQSPYAQTKAMFESILRDAAAAGELRALSLRYFNPVGADPQLRTGSTLLEPTHVLGSLLAAWRDGRPFTITGVDWPTRDGSGMRDYIHVWDLAQAHVFAVQKFDEIATPAQPYRALNIGTGTGVTVRELVAAAREVLPGALDVQEGPPRPGDNAGVYTRSDLARRALGWEPKLSLPDAIRHASAWEPHLRELRGRG